MKTDSLYTKVVEITAAYLGPAANRFICLVVVGHLDKAPEKIKASELEGLMKWIKPAAGLLVEDKRVVDQYIARLKKLTELAVKNG